MKSNVTFILILTTAFTTINAKTFEICEIKDILEKEEWMENEIADWICLIEAESSFRSNVTGKLNRQEGNWPDGKKNCY